MRSLNSVIIAIKDTQEDDFNNSMAMKCSPMAVKAKKMGNNLRFEVQAEMEEEEEAAAAEKAVMQVEGDVIIQNDSLEIFDQDNLEDDPYSK